MAGEIATEEEEGREPPPGARPQWLSALAERWGRQRDDRVDALVYGLWATETVAVVTGQWVLTGTQSCPSCGPGRCDGTTQDCTLDSYYANPANGPRPSAGTAQNPDPLPAYGWGMWPGYTYPATKYDEEHAPVTERGPAPAPAPAVAWCECGSGSSVRSGAHSHWCPCWVAP